MIGQLSTTYRHCRFAGDVQGRHHPWACFSGSAPHARWRVHKQILFYSFNQPVDLKRVCLLCKEGRTEEDDGSTKDKMHNNAHRTQMQAHVHSPSSLPEQREWSVANPDQADDHQLMRVVVGESRMLSSLW
jgi:hypothetical protein